MPPDIYTPVRKPWGTSTVCYRDEHVEVVKIIVLPGGFCSRHLHQRKWNQFVVVQGELTIELFDCGGIYVGPLKIGPGNERHDVLITPEQQHRFRSPRWGGSHPAGKLGSTGGAIAYEIYTAAPGEKLGHGDADIVRFEDGGRD